MWTTYWWEDGGFGGQGEEDCTQLQAENPIMLQQVGCDVLLPDAFAASGFDAHSLAGGIIAWKESGRAVEGDVGAVDRACLGGRREVSGVLEDDGGAVAGRAVDGERRRREACVAEAIVEHFHDVKAHVEADEVGQRQRAHRMVGARLHRGVDLLDLRRDARGGLVERGQVVQVKDDRRRSFGDWKCPMVIYAPYGAYLPGGSLWHSQANEATIVHYPGLNVVIPSTPDDAAGLLWSAMHAEDPTVVLIPKHMLWVEQEVKQPIAAVPVGHARRFTEGTEVTIVAWGNTVEKSLEAITQLGDSVEHEPREVIGGQPLTQARRQQQLLLAIARDEVCAITESS